MKRLVEILYINRGVIHSMHGKNDHRASLSTKETSGLTETESRLINQAADRLGNRIDNFISSFVAEIEAKISEQDRA